MRITEKRSTMVLPATDTPQHGLWISNLDHVRRRLHAPTVYFYRSDGSNNFFDAQVMKESLGRALVLFYPVAGRLRRGEDGRLEINCNGQGVFFVEASAEGMMDDFGDFSATTTELRQLVPHVDYSDDISSYPLLLLQVTVFKCGGVCLGVSLHHTMVDGFAALHFVNSWSDLARGMDVHFRPIIDRAQILRARDAPNPTFQPIEFQPPPILKSKNVLMLAEEAQATATTRAATFKFSRDQLAKLKDKVNGSSTKYTTYECLAAHVWRCVCLARGLDDDQKTRLHVAVDGRSRLRPQIPKHFFGNLVIDAAVIGVVRDLLSRPLHYAASKIHDVVLQVDDEYVRSTIDYLELQPDLDGMVRGARTWNSPNLKISSWVRLPLYDADFGWGKPISMGPVGIAIDGSGYILPNPANDGSLSVTIALHSDALRALETLIYDIFI